MVNQTTEFIKQTKRRPQGSDLFSFLMGEHGTGKLETGKQFYLTMPLLAWWRNVALVVYCTVLYCILFIYTLLLQISTVSQRQNDTVD